MGSTLCSSPSPCLHLPAGINDTTQSFDGGIVDKWHFNLATVDRHAEAGIGFNLAPIAQYI